MLESLSFLEQAESGKKVSVYISIDMYPWIHASMHPCIYACIHAHTHTHTNVRTYNETSIHTIDT